MVVSDSFFPCVRRVGAEKEVERCAFTAYIGGAFCESLGEYADGVAERVVVENFRRDFCTSCPLLSSG